jgi:hypothetical protein
MEGRKTSTFGTARDIIDAVEVPCAFSFTGPVVNFPIEAKTQDI